MTRKWLCRIFHIHIFHDDFGQGMKHYRFQRCRCGKCRWVKV